MGASLVHRWGRTKFPPLSVEEEGGVEPSPRGGDGAQGTVTLSLQEVSVLLDRDLDHYAPALAMPDGNRVKAEMCMMFVRPDADRIVNHSSRMRPAAPSAPMRI